ATAAASAAAILVRRSEYVRSMMSSSRGQRCTDRIQTAGLVVAGGASKRDREPVPAVDGHNRQRQRDELVLGELGPRKLVDRVRDLLMLEPRDGFRPREGCPLPFAVDIRFAPRGKQIEPL